MNLIKNLPGPFLVFLGAVSLSFGGLIVKSFEGSTLWQILFWRSVFFIVVVSIFLLITYKKKVISAFYNSNTNFVSCNIWLHIFEGNSFKINNVLYFNRNFRYFFNAW